MQWAGVVAPRRVRGRVGGRPVTGVQEKAAITGRVAVEKEERPVSRSRG